jgi:hypothetical protein
VPQPLQRCRLAALERQHRLAKRTMCIDEIAALSDHGTMLPACMPLYNRYAKFRQQVLWSDSWQFQVCDPDLPLGGFLASSAAVSPQGLLH